MLECSNGVGCAQTRGNNEVHETRFLFLQIWLIRPSETGDVGVSYSTIPYYESRTERCLEIENHLARYFIVIRVTVIWNVKNSDTFQGESRISLLDARNIFLIFTLRTFSALRIIISPSFFSQISRNISNVIFRKLARNYSNSGNISAHVTDINIEIIYRTFFPFFPSISANVRECRRFIVGEIEGGKKKKKKFFPPHRQSWAAGETRRIGSFPIGFVDVAGANVRTSILI